MTAPAADADAAAATADLEPAAFDTPIALFVFNRPETTARVLERIAGQRPRRLLVVCDGPRADRAGEAERVAEVQALIAARIDWPCELRTDYAPRNLGCRARLASGLDWVFSEVDEAILLEDDCLPDPSFFRWCREMLERHREDPRVMMVSGNNFLFRTPPAGAPSYHYSRFSHIWGWATWRRAWQHYGGALDAWRVRRDSDWLERRLPVPGAAEHYRAAFDALLAGRIDTWDYQWDLTVFLHDGLSVVPSVHLVENLGIGVGATHTTTPPIEARAVCGTLAFPLRHPPAVAADLDADRREFACLHPRRPLKSFLRRLRRRLRAALHLRSGASPE